MAQPFLKIIGAVLLFWIGVKMLIPDDDSAEFDSSEHLWTAIKTIIIADLVMSLDNVLGVAAAAKGSVVLLILGLAISIPLIIYGSTLLLKLMQRWPVIITVGGAVLGWVAGEMMVTDPADQRLGRQPGPLAAHRGAGVRRAVRRGDGQVDHDVPRGPGRGGAITGSLFSKERKHERNPDAGWCRADLGRHARPRKAGNPGRRTASSRPRMLPPVGYRWISKRWRVLPDGTRDYAAFHGKTAFNSLLPVSSRLRSSKR